MKRVRLSALLILLCLPALAQVADKKNYVHTLALADRVRRIDRAH